MARFDGNLKAAGEAELNVDELLSALPAGSGRGERERQEAIACFLSVSEGWRDAREALKGAFAGDMKPSWLTGDKD